MSIPDDSPLRRYIEHKHQKSLLKEQVDTGFLMICPGSASALMPVHAIKIWRKKRHHAFCKRCRISFITYDDHLWTPVRPPLLGLKEAEALFLSQKMEEAKKEWAAMLLNMKESAS